MNNIVSIIIPLYNREKLVIDTLNSIIGQTYPHWEAIIVDDGSTDNSISVVEDFSKKDDRIKIYKRGRLPKGPSTCRNIGMEKAIGDYVMFLDSDDILSLNCLENRISFLDQNKHCDFIVFNSLLFDNSSNYDDINILWNIENEENDLLRFLRFDGVWAINGPIYKKEYISNFKFNTEIPFFEDAEIAIRILLSKPVYIKKFDFKPDVFIRWHLTDSLSRTVKNPDLYLKNTVFVVNNVVSFVESSRIKMKFVIKKQFIFLFYNISKQAFYCNNTKKLINFSLKNILRFFPVGVFFYLFFLSGQLVIYFTAKNKNRLFVKIRIVTRNALEFVIYRILKINRTSLFKVKIK